MVRSPTALHKRLFGELLDVPREEREAALARLVDGDAELERRLRGLLAAHEKAESVLGSLDGSSPLEVPATLAQEVDALEAGDRIAAYELTRELGHGGFGRVWLAEQHEPVKRPVALKLLKAGMDTREVVARFEAERQALAVHGPPVRSPRSYDGGARRDKDRPYFVMEYVEGVHDHGVLRREAASPLEGRLEPVRARCAMRSVQHAHTQGRSSTAT